MSVGANTKKLSAIIAVLLLLHPFIRLIYSAPPVCHVKASIHVAWNHDPSDFDTSISSDDRPADTAAPVRRARINADTVRDYMVALRAPLTLLARLVDPHSGRLDEGRFAFAPCVFISAPMHETRGKPQGL